MIDQCAQIGACALSAGTFKHNAAEAQLCKMVVERFVVLNVNFAAALCDLVQRRLRDEEMAVFDNLRHLAIEECQQQCADMRPVDVSVGHDHNLVIAQLFNVEIFAANARAHGLNERAHFLGRKHPVKTGALDVQDFTLQRQNRLIMAVATLLCRTTCGVAFDQEQFGLCRVFFLTVGQLAGQRRNAHDRFAARLARFTGGFAGGGGVNDLLDHGARMARIFFKPLAHPVGHQAFQRLAHFG